MNTRIKHGLAMLMVAVSAIAYILLAQFAFHEEHLDPLPVADATNHLYECEESEYR